MAITDQPGPLAGHQPLDPGDPVETPGLAELIVLNREAIRTLHLVARELDGAVHARCLHQPLGAARDATLNLAVRLQLALRELD